MTSEREIDDEIETALGRAIRRENEAAATERWRHDPAGPVAASLDISSVSEISNSIDTASASGRASNNIGDMGPIGDIGALNSAESSLSGIGCMPYERSIQREVVDLAPGIEKEVHQDYNHFYKQQGEVAQEAAEAESARIKRRSNLMAWYVGTLAALGGFLYGYDTGNINSILSMPFVKQHFPGNNESFTAIESSITTSILSVGTCFGAMSSPLLSDRVGRRITSIIATLIVFNIGIVLQVIASALPLLCVGRFFTGWAVGIISAVIPLYQAETSPKWIRGSIISLYQWAITWGLLVSSAVAQGTHRMDSAACYRIPIGIQMAPAIFLSVCMYMLPESPRYYVKRGRLDDAIMSLSRLRRLPPENKAVIEELIEIKASSDYEQSFGSTSLRDCFVDSPARVCQGKRMATGILLQALQQCSGINFIFYYGVNFFANTGVSNSYLMSFITYITNAVFTVPGIFFVDLLGRRTLLLWGAVGMAVCNFIIAIVGTQIESIVANKVMIAFVCGFIACFASTWGPIGWVVVGELFPLSVRQKCVSLSATTNWIVNFAFAFCTPYMIDTGNHTAELGTKIFFVWGSLNLLSFVLVYLLVYETKGLMLEEIDEMYRVCKTAHSSAHYKKPKVPGEPEVAPKNNNGDMIARENACTGGSTGSNDSHKSAESSGSMGSSSDVKATTVTTSEMSRKEHSGSNMSIQESDDARIMIGRNDRPPSIGSDSDLGSLDGEDDDPERPDAQFTFDALAYGDSAFYGQGHESINYVQSLGRSSN